MSLAEHFSEKKRGLFSDWIKLISYIILPYLVMINQKDSKKICALLSLFTNLQQNLKDPEQLCWNGYSPLAKN